MRALTPDIGGQWLEHGLGGRVLRRLLQREAGLQETQRVVTPRELEIVRMVAHGLRNRAIGDRLCVSEGTLKVHVHNIDEKLGVSSRGERLA